MNDRFRDRDAFRNTNLNIDRGEINNRWESHRGDWDNHWHDRHWYHNNWYHGHCHWGWHPGYMWDNYPVLTAFGVTTWAINRWNWASGYYPYYNPYATPTIVNQSSTYYDYSQPIQEVETYPETADDGTATPHEVSQETISVFDRATQEFKADQFETALNSVNEAIKQSPNDAAMHEFRALALFSLGRYDEAAATLYAVLGVGPGWDWTTMISLYSSSEVYTGQLRKLEAFVKNNPQSASARFVLAYHYITHGHEADAAKQLTEVVKLQPDDTLARDLLLGIDPDADIPKPEIVQPPKPTQKVNADALEGTWTARRSGGDRFTMALRDGGTFTWTYEGG
ncbi:MAG TPA: tetratricopeptide repeat protein, partial [Planctomycetaceae bacterium]|nr:tetratricopeptide repeat protein [Planctomycetaceae bacterium]